MTIQTATEFVAARFKARGFQRTWSPDMEARLGEMMLRDAIAAGVAPTAPKFARSPTGRFLRTGDGNRSARAREMIEEGATPEAVMAETGLVWRTVSDLFREAGQPVRKPMPLSEAGARARRMAKNGATAREIARATGISISTATRLAINKTPGTGGSQPTPEGVKAREMAAAGEGVDAILAATGFARRTVLKIVREAREAAA